MLENMNQMLDKAKKNKYCVPQFNINNLEWTRFILEEANKEKSPVILGVSEGAAKYMGGYKLIVSMVKELVSYLNIDVPVALHLDHGSSFEVCKEAIDAGFTSVMIDASKNSLEENIRITKKVVEYASNYNVSVEAEIGHINTDTADEAMYADVNECQIFYKETHINALAPALGSVHGLYKGEPKLDFNRMFEISNLLNIPLVLHGGTGINDELLKKAISCGICKLNINTELQIEWSKNVRKYLNENNDVYDPRKIIKSGELAMKKAIQNKIYVLGSNNRA